jgi:hypothetical protein
VRLAALLPYVLLGTACASTGKPLRNERPRFTLTLDRSIGLAPASGQGLSVVATVRQVGGPPACPSISWALMSAGYGYGDAKLNGGSHEGDCPAGEAWAYPERRTFRLGPGVYSVVASLNFADYGDVKLTRDVKVCPCSSGSEEAR